jgi:hypothetical protein
LGTAQLPKVTAEPIVVSETKPDFDAQAERFKSYFANLDKDRLHMLAADEEDVMGKTSNLEGLDLEISQPKLDDALLMQDNSTSGLMDTLNLYAGAEKQLHQVGATVKMNEPEDEDSMHESAKQPKTKKSTGAEQLTWAALEQNEPYDNEWLARSIKENVEVWKKEMTE